jgi:hypothetical protein
VREYGDAIDFLGSPLESYLFVSRELWEERQATAPPTVRVLGRRRDRFRDREVLVVGNRPPPAASFAGTPRSSHD